jgi:hypothetical protein
MDSDGREVDIDNMDHYTEYIKKVSRYTPCRRMGGEEV